MTTEEKTWTRKERAIEAIKNCVRWPVRQALRHMPRNRKYRNILFPCYYALMAEYQRDLWELLRDDPHLRFYITLHKPEIKPGEHDRIRKLLPLPEVSGAWANVRPWDLVVLADHGFEELCTPSRFPVLRIPHGIAGKSRYGEEYQYGKRAFTHDGRFRYSLMFEPSQATRDRVVADRPWLDKHIAVVGSPQMDRVIEQSPRRDEFRRRLGFKPDEIVVFVTSTWGEHSLFHTMGESIIEEARKLIGPFRFVMSAHPMDFRPWPYNTRVWGEYLRTLKSEGFDVREPSDPWLPYMIASDIVLTDHTSLAIYGSPITRPTVFVPLDDNLLAEGSAIWQLWQMSPELNDASSLRETLLGALQDYPYSQLAQLASDINACPGFSADRIREEIYGLLNIDPAWAAVFYPPKKAETQPLPDFSKPAIDMPSFLPETAEAVVGNDIA